MIEGVDLMVVRELTGGVYFGTPKGRVEADGHVRAFNTMAYSDYEIDRIAKVGFDLAAARGGRLCSVDKANVLESSRLWRDEVIRVAAEHPDVELEHMLVDNAAMQLVSRPSDFDVIVTENLFGDNTYSGPVWFNSPKPHKQSLDAFWRFGLLGMKI